MLLPGLDGTGKLLRALCETLKDRINTEVIAYPTNQALGYDELTQFVADRLPSQPFVLLGESFSGPIAIRLAAKPPAGLKGLILCGTFGKNPYPWLGWAAPVAGVGADQVPASLAAGSPHVGRPFTAASAEAGRSCHRSR